TRLSMFGAADRATIVGAPLPTDSVLLFPGAAPIRLDTPELAIDPSSAVIRMDNTTGEDTQISVVASDAGIAMARGAVATALAGCLRGQPLADLRCPLPNPRAVPGTLRAVLPGNVAKAVQVSVSPDDTGLFDISGTVRFTGEYSLLDFDNIASS